MSQLYMASNRAVISCSHACLLRHHVTVSRAEPALVRLALALAGRSGDDSLGYLSHTQQLRLVLRQMAFQRRGY